MGLIEHFVPALRAWRDEGYGCAEAGNLQILRSQQGEGFAKIGGEFGELGDVDFGTKAAEVNAADAWGGAGVNNLRERPIRAGEC